MYRPFSGLFICLSAVPTTMQGIMGYKTSPVSQDLRGKSLHRRSVLEFLPVFLMSVDCYSREGKANCVGCFSD